MRSSSRDLGDQICPAEGLYRTLVAWVPDHVWNGRGSGATGFIFQAIGHLAGFMVLTGAAIVATALLWLVMPETKPGKYLD